MHNLLSFLLIDSSYPINTRNAKIIYSLKRISPEFSVKFIAWNRDGRRILDEDQSMPVYEKKSVYGKPIQKALNLFGYYRFLKCYNDKKKPNILIASHWDMLLLASIFKKRDQILIYENLDIPTSNNRLLLFLLKRIERMSLKRTDAIIFASRFFVELYQNFQGKKFLIENKPLSNRTFPVNHSIGEEDVNNPLIISYIGLVRYADILKHLVDAVRDLPVVLNIHGEGPDLAELKTYAMDCKNVNFTGRYEQTCLPLLYAQSHMVWAAYPNKDYNVKYAISNKFHESIAYGVPCIFSNNTKLGDFVKAHGIGLNVDPYSTKEIKKLIEIVISHRDMLTDIQSKLSLFSQEESSWDDDFSILEKYLKSLCL